MKWLNMVKTSPFSLRFRPSRPNYHSVGYVYIYASIYPIVLLFHIICSMIIRLYFLVLDELTPKSLCLPFTKCIFGVEISPSHDHFPSTFPWHISFLCCSMLTLLQIQIDVENGPCMYRLFAYICFTYWKWWLSIAMLNNQRVLPIPRLCFGQATACILDAVPSASQFLFYSATLTKEVTQLIDQAVASSWCAEMYVIIC